MTREQMDEVLEPAMVWIISRKVRFLFAARRGAILRQRNSLSLYRMILIHELHLDGPPRLPLGCGVKVTTG